MKKRFPTVFVLILTGIFLFSCVKKDSKKQTEENLKTAFDLFLNHNPKIDTSRVKFKTLDVAFFEAKMGYICEFKVNMKERRDSGIIDTVGVMNANVSKDFKDVTRR
jgi:diketogulonate reductase-like aldo/keto reductase